ncbi:transposase [Streptomyces halstedii]|uniref:transposase n=1 Tax=Streptomyces halstedii TaxID=1944 RepID=UPI0036C11AFD
MSAISTKGRMLFMVFTEHFTAEVMCRFLERLAGHVDHKVHLVVDGHSAHRSKKVRDWLAAHPDDVAALPAAVLARAEPRRAGQCRTKHGLPKQHRARDQAEPAAETREPGAERSSTNTEHLRARYGCSGSSIRSVWWSCRTQCTPPRQAITYAPSHE